MAANDLVREGVVVICDYLIRECQHTLEKRNKRKKTTLVVNSHILPSRTSSFAAILESTASFTFVEPCEQYRSTVEFR
jgi:hypothetical protein